MANVEVNDLAAKTAPVKNDEIEAQETGGGASKKVTIDDLWHGLVNARGHCQADGTLDNNSIGVASVAHPSTGEYDITLDTALSDANTGQYFVTCETGGGYCSARPTSTTVIHVELWVGGATPSTFNGEFSFLILDEG